MAVIGAQVARWDIERGAPYQCVFDVTRGARPMTVQVSLAPEVGNMVIDIGGAQRELVAQHRADHRVGRTEVVREEVGGGERQEQPGAEESVIVLH